VETSSKSGAFKWGGVGCKDLRPYKAPGIDGIYPILLQEGLKYLVGSLTKIFRASIALRRVPQAWKNIEVVFIPKPGKNGHICAKDFRPMSLTSFLLKFLERLVDRYLKIGPLVKCPLAATYNAYREGRSTETALDHLLSRVERELEMKEYAIVAFLDIKGAFDNTSIDTVKQAIIGHDIPEVLVDWTENMLAGRRMMVYYGEKMVEGTGRGSIPTTVVPCSKQPFRGFTERKL
jgi:hypothetical protein